MHVLHLRALLFKVARHALVWASVRHAVVSACRRVCCGVCALSRSRAVSCVHVCGVWSESVKA